MADPGDTVTLTAAVSGGRPLTYLWFQNGTLLSCTTNGPLALSPVTTNSSGLYQLVLTNLYGAATSAVAQLTVVSGPITNALVVHLPFDGNFNDFVLGPWAQRPIRLERAQRRPESHLYPGQDWPGLPVHHVE